MYMGTEKITVETCSSQGGDTKKPPVQGSTWMRGPTEAAQSDDVIIQEEAGDWKSRVLGVFIVVTCTCVRSYA